MLGGGCEGGVVKMELPVNFERQVRPRNQTFGIGWREKQFTTNQPTKTSINI